MIYRTVQRVGSADVKGGDADISRASARRHFLAGQHLDELLGTTAGVDRRHRDNFNRKTALSCRHTQGGDGFGLVVLDAHQHVVAVEHETHDCRTLQNFDGTLAHQHVVAADPRLAFAAIENQCRHLLRCAGVELDETGEHRAAESGDSHVAQ